MEHFVDVPVQGNDVVTGAGGEPLQSSSIFQRGEGPGIVRQVRIISQQFRCRDSSDAIGREVLQGQLRPVLGHNLPRSTVELDEIKEPDSFHDAAAMVGIANIF